MYIPHFAYPFIHQWFTAVNTGVQISTEVPTLKSFENIPRSGIAG